MRETFWRDGGGNDWVSSCRSAQGAAGGARGVLQPAAGGGHGHGHGAGAWVAGSALTCCHVMGSNAMARTTRAASVAPPDLCARHGGIAAAGPRMAGKGAAAVLLMCAARGFSALAHSLRTHTCPRSCGVLPLVLLEICTKRALSPSSPPILPPTIRQPWGPLSPCCAAWLRWGVPALAGVPESENHETILAPPSAWSGRYGLRTA